MFVHELICQGEPDSLAIVDHERRITYRELQEHVAACRNRLYAAGVRVGDRVSIFSRNSADYIYAYMAIASLGAIAVPINFQLSNREIAAEPRRRTLRPALRHARDTARHPPDGQD